MALCVSSWRKIQAMENYKDFAGEHLFRRVFEISPSAARLFHFGSKGITDETFKQELFLRHARGVISTVDIAIELVARNDIDTLTTALRDLGAKHATYGVKYEHFPVVGRALLDTIAKALGGDFTPELRQAWMKVYGLIAHHMSDGMEHLMQ